MKDKILITAIILFCPLFVPHSNGQEHRVTYSTLWLRHNDSTSERLLLYKKNNEQLQIGEATFMKFVIANLGEFYCRTDGEKMIRYDLNTSSEYILYDFGLEKGEIFETPDGRFMQVVEKGDTLFCKGMPAFHYLQLINISNPSDTDVWIAGYGSLHTSILLPEELGDDIAESRLLFDYVGPLANIFHSEYIQSQMMVIEKETEYFTYDSEQDKIEYIPDSLHCEFKKDTLVVSGRLQRLGSDFHYLSCETNGSEILFRVDELPVFVNTNMMYYFTAKFPGFKSGEYIVNYKDENFGFNEINIKVVCDESATSIVSSPLQEGLDSGAVYDLSGRHLSCPPERGIYIQGGRVRVK